MPIIRAYLTHLLKLQDLSEYLNLSILAFGSGKEISSNFAVVNPLA